MSNDIVCEYLNGIPENNKSGNLLQSAKLYVKNQVGGYRTWGGTYRLEIIKTHVRNVLQNSTKHTQSSYFSREYQKYSLFIFINEQRNRMQRLLDDAEGGYKVVYTEGNIINNNMDHDVPRLNLLLVEWDKDFWESKSKAGDMNAVLKWQKEMTEKCNEYFKELEDVYGLASKPVKYDFSFLLEN